MKSIHDQAEQLTKDVQSIEKMLSDKMPLENIQSTIAQAGQALAGLYASTAKEIRRQNANTTDS